jgi:hypothetical protein
MTIAMIIVMIMVTNMITTESTYVRTLSTAFYVLLSFPLNEDDLQEDFQKDLEIQYLRIF